MNEISIFIRDYNIQKDVNHMKLLLKPGRYYSEMFELHRPILIPDEEEYCKHIKIIPKWLWEWIRYIAIQKLSEYNRLKKYDVSEEQVKHWKLIADGTVPYKIKVI